MLTGDAPAALLDAVRQAGLDTVEGAFHYAEGDDLVKPGLGYRRRTRIALTDADGGTHELYLKRYAKTGVGTSMGRWFRHGRRASAARIEFDNIRAVRQAGVATMREIACGEDACPLGCGRSYLIVSAVPGDALERCFDEYLASHDTAASGELTRRLARLVRSLHEAGLAHRDLYASHLFLDESDGREDLYLIDLARVIRPGLRRRRWFVKDLAQIRYSMPSAWTDRHWDAFLAEYLGDAGDVAVWNGLVDRKVAEMCRRDGRRRARAAGQGGGAA